MSELAVSVPSAGRFSVGEGVDVVSTKRRYKGCVVDSFDFHFADNYEAQREGVVGTWEPGMVPGRW